MRISGKISTGGSIAGRMGRAERVNVQELVFGNRYEFPNIGDPKLEYIAVDENAVYRYDEADRAYYCIGRDYNEIEAINVRLKED